MKVAIVGSRAYFDTDDVYRYVNALPSGTEVVTGGATGVDWHAEHAARKRGLTVTVFRADWNGPAGRNAGHVRNKQIVDYADRIVAFWDGKSRGTKNAISLARKLGKPLETIQSAKRN